MKVDVIYDKTSARVFKDGDFIPYGLYLDADGDPAIVGGDGKIIVFFNNNIAYSDDTFVNWPITPATPGIKLVVEA